MDIKYKLYPYPVLTEYSDDYKDRTFKTSVDMVKDGYDLRLDFVSELTSDTIKSLILQKKASYVYHLECAQTGFRHVIITSNTEERYLLDKKLVRGKLQVCTFIVAREDLHHFACDEFHQDYEGMEFEIEAGCVIAVGSQVNFDIQKEIDDIANLPSIFSIIKNTDMDVKEMLVESESNKIIVKLPFYDFSTYKQLSRDANNYPILNALTVIPALTFVMSELKQRDPDERSEIDYGWYRTVKNVLLKTFEIDIESDSFDELNTLEYAQKLINSPIPEAFNSLFSGGESDGDD